MQCVCMMRVYDCEKERESVCLTSVVDSGDGVSIEHAVEEGIGVFRELRDDKDRGGSNIHHKAQYSTHTHTRSKTRVVA